MHASLTGTRLGLLAIFGLGSTLAACSGSTASHTVDADHGSTHALVSIERRDSPDASLTLAQAFASFVRTPPEVDPSVVRRVTGLDLGLPELGQCTAAPGRDGSMPLSPFDRVELLDAGDVALRTPDGRVELAPRPFPAVTDQISGVVYTTRDRAAQLPPAERYALDIAGSAELPPLAVDAEAPPRLEDVTLDGAPLEAGARLTRSGALLGWAPGSERDLVYVTLSGPDGARSAVCAFPDAGRGVLPASVLPSAGPATLSVHRLRAVALNAGVDAGELRFDFELFVPVEVVQ
ncbi:MAG TPA: hypothetical protein VKY73_10055 [Polyangiaceae bacterium]|nr:hypothetical protein [Polyangiaceae bacterium]